MISTELDRLFPAPIEILAEPGRFLVASAATAVSQIIGKAIRGGKLCYYINDGVYQTFSGVIFDHCQYPLKSFTKGPTQICSVFGPTCDALDTISLTERTPGPGDGRTALRGQHRRLFRRQQHIFQRLSAGQSCTPEPGSCGHRLASRFAIAALSFLTRTLELRPLCSYFSRRTAEGHSGYLPQSRPSIRSR